MTFEDLKRAAWRWLVAARQAETEAGRAFDKDDSDEAFLRFQRAQDDRMGAEIAWFGVCSVDTPED